MNVRVVGVDVGVFRSGSIREQQTVGIRFIHPSHIGPSDAYIGSGFAHFAYALGRNMPGSLDLPGRHAFVKQFED